MGNRQLDAWRGSFGDDYVERTLGVLSDDNIRMRVRLLVEMLGHIQYEPPSSIIDVGCNIGLNLRALRQVTSAELWAVEPNANARSVVVRDEVIAESHLKDGTADSIPFDDDQFDLSLTSGVLIHIAPDNLDAACKEIHRVSKRYILSAEYFSHEPRELHYRGHDSLLYTRDFGSHWLELCPDLEPVANGFFWKKTTGADNVNWWLFRKK